MKVANTVDLKNNTNRILRGVMNGRPVIVTLRGKPAAAIIRLTEDGLEDFILEHSPRIKRMIEEGEEARLRGEVIPLREYRRSKRRHG